jgi:hypothetical protein
MDQNSTTVRKTNWEKQLNKLKKFSRSKGYEVRICDIKDKISYVNLKTKLIKIYSGHCTEFQCYLIMHELGHIILSDDDKQYKTNVAYGQYNFSRNSLTNKVSLFEEEIEAWKVGHQLAKDLKIPVKRKRFEQLKSSCLATYGRVFFKKKEPREENESNN